MSIIVLNRLLCRGAVWQRYVFSWFVEIKNRHYLAVISRRYVSDISRVAGEFLLEKRVEEAYGIRRRYLYGNIGHYEHP
jgi:hypothetical protein